VVEAGEQAGREVVLADQPAEQHLGVDVAQHGPAGADGRAADLDADGPAALDDHAVGGGAAAQRPALGDEPPGEGAGQLTGAALGHGVADGLADHGEQPAEHAARRRLGGQVGVQGVAGEQQAAAGAAERLVRHPPDGQQGEAGEVEQLARADGGAELEAAAHGRERRQQRLDQGRADPLPAVEQAVPGLAVARGELLERGGGVLGPAVEDGRRPVDARVGHHRRGVHPAQPVRLEVEGGEHARRRGQGVEGAEQVVAEAGGGHLGGADGTAGRVLRLDDEHLPPGVDQHVRRHQAVGPGADDDGVVGLHRLSAPRRRRPRGPTGRARRRGRPPASRGA
jgi:hypothetical protein